MSSELTSLGISSNNEISNVKILSLIRDEFPKCNLSFDDACLRVYVRNGFNKKQTKTDAVEKINHRACM